jgi:hypothetical protein
VIAGVAVAIAAVGITVIATQTSGREEPASVAEPAPAAASPPPPPPAAPSVVDPPAPRIEPPVAASLDAGVPAPADAGVAATRIDAGTSPVRKKITRPTRPVEDYGASRK